MLAIGKRPKTGIEGSDKTGIDGGSKTGIERTSKPWIERNGLGTLITPASSLRFSGGRGAPGLASRAGLRAVTRLLIARCRRSWLPARFGTPVGLPGWRCLNGFLSRCRGSPSRRSLRMGALLPPCERRDCHQDYDAGKETAHGTPHYTAGWQAFPKHTPSRVSGHRRSYSTKASTQQIHQHHQLVVDPSDQSLPLSAVRIGLG